MALGPARRARLGELELHRLVPELGIELVHGSLSDQAFGFVATAEAALETLRLAAAPFVLCAHTHEAAHWVQRGTGRVEALPIELGVEVELRELACLDPGAGCDSAGARWMELLLGASGKSAIWHRAAVPGHGGRALAD